MQSVYNHQGQVIFQSVQLLPWKQSFKNQVSKIVSEYDQEIPQSQTADYPVAPRGRAAQPSRAIRKTH